MKNKKKRKMYPDFIGEYFEISLFEISRVDCFFNSYSFFL